MPEPTTTELEPGLFQVTMPLPWALDHVHCYVLAPGMPGGLAAASARAEGGTAVHPAAPTVLVEEGDTVGAGERQWRVLQLPGHADGHIALHDERGGRLLGGDVLLDEITPNV